MTSADVSLLTAADVAARLQLSVRTVRRRIAEKKLRVVRLGRAVRVRPEDLESYVDASGQEWPEDVRKSTVELE